MLMASWYRKLNQGGFNGRLPSDRLPSISTSWRCQAGIEPVTNWGTSVGVAPYHLTTEALLKLGLTISCHMLTNPIFCEFIV
jgi:hypothetical protein